MRGLWLALAVALAGAACAARGRTPAPVGNDRSAATERHPTPTACPPDGTLKDIARRAWEVRDDVITAECLPLWAAGSSLWYLVGWFESPSDPGWVEHATAVVTPEGDVRWSDSDLGVRAGAIEPVRGGTLKAVDLDGDGSDEIVHEVVQRYPRSRSTTRTLLIDGVDDHGELIGGASILLSGESIEAPGEDSDACAGSYEIVDGPSRSKLLLIDRDGPGCDSLHARFRWNGEELERSP
jgi:hypothetical protein